MFLFLALIACGPLEGDWNGELEIIPPGDDKAVRIRRVGAFEDGSNLHLQAEKRDITFDLIIRLEELSFSADDGTTPFDAPIHATGEYTGPGGPLTMADVFVIATDDLTADVPLVNFAELKLTDKMVSISLEFGCIDDFEKGSNFYDDGGADCVAIDYRGEVLEAE